MNRLLLFVFALVALGVAGYQVLLFERSFERSAAAEAAAGASGAAAEIALRIEARRAELQRAALAVAAAGVALPSTAPAPARPGARSPEAPAPVITEERLAAVRSVALRAVGSSLRPRLVVVLAGPSDGLLSVGEAAGAALPAELDRAAVEAAGAEGVVLPALGRGHHLFVSAPLHRGAGVVAVGGPLLDDAAAALTDAVRASGVAAAALLEGRSVVASAGASSSLAQVGSVAPGAVVSLSRGPVETLGPLAFPLLESTMALEVGAHRAIAGTRYGIVAVASARAAVLRLVALERSALVALAGLFLVALAFVLVAGGGGESHDELAPALAVPPPVPVPPVPSRARTTGLRLALQPSQAPARAMDALDDPAAPGEGEATLGLPLEPSVVPELSPDDFEFPSGPAPKAATSAAGARRGAGARVAEPEGPADEAAPAQEPSGGDLDDPFANMADASAPPARVSPKGPLGGMPLAADELAVETKAHPVMRAPQGRGAVRAKGAAERPELTLDGVGPAGTSADEGADEGGEVGDHDSGVGAEPEESTRVAAVPVELMRQARASDPNMERLTPRPASTQRAIAPPAASPTSVTVATPAPAQPPAPQRGTGGFGVADEERHFQDIFREFLATRERCGEASDGLTFEKFKAKLLKNKEQMLAKYNSRSVRFQVYVKEGKAAIKASPTKD